jgi:5-methylcytosine-specific restriction endonuclease McrA
VIKIERNLESPKITEAIETLKKEKAKSNGSYNKLEVLDALTIVFNKKCYICENKKITSYNIEHLRPHKNKNLDLKFNFENLFLACAHCNNIKSDHYENILDCTKVDVDELIAFRKNGNFSWDESIEITALKHSQEIDETVDLLQKVYSGTTEMKKLEWSNIRKELRTEIVKFIDAINDFKESFGDDKEDAKNLIKRHLKSNSPFAGFKRWIVKDNVENLDELL